MIGIRFHGRGGQGMKTASRIVGTAALLDGFLAQDCPVYGAERRGAPMAAFTRVSRWPIHERGLIVAPDIVAVADDSLLDDPAVRPLTGLAPSGSLLIATPHPEDEVRRHTGHRGVLVARDLVSLALEMLGNAAGVSTALAAMVCAQLGLSEASTRDALVAELAAIGLEGDAIASSLHLAAEARVGLPVLTPPDGCPGSRRPRAVVVDVDYDPAEVGAPSVLSGPNTSRRKTGGWRVFTPRIDLERCTACWVCFVRCPEGAITLDAEQRPHIDYDVCKGCLICVEECPTGAITREREERVWAPAETTA